MSDESLDIFGARDSSVTGVGIFVPYRFEAWQVKTPVDLVITLPGAEPFFAKSHIIHRTKTAREFFGVEFVDLPQALTLESANHVERRLGEDRGESSNHPAS